MYTIELLIRNPINQEMQRLFYQFDPATMTQTKWNNAYAAAVKPAIDALVASAAATEPPKW